MSLVTILDELAVQIADAVGDDVQVISRMNFNPTPPSIDMYPGDSVSDDQTAAFDDDTGGWFITVRARVGTSDNEAGQDDLLEFMDDEGTRSIALAVLDDPTIGGTATSADISSQTGYMLVPTPDGGAYLGCLWTFLIIPARS